MRSEFPCPGGETGTWLQETVRAETGQELTHIIDLTATDRYYSPSLCSSLGIGHTKIHVPGHVIPGQELVDQFYRAVEAASKDEEGLIGVHCTHGLNRSDYVGTQSIPKIHHLFHLSKFNSSVNCFDIALFVKLRQGPGKDR